ncbi:MAG: deoxyribonuclease V [Dehalococcoidales bacterium]|nr:deoxyribonuclease V [Dehalococcoidales bacterium]
MDTEEIDNLKLSPEQAIELQRKLSKRVVTSGEVISPGYIAGVDIATWRDKPECQAAIVILSYPALEIAEIEVAQGEINFPYIPGLLSFREIPLILEAWRKIKLMPDIIMVDGQGIAHPRRIGLASHLGVLLNIPSIGCAKSRLCGSFEISADEPGSYSNLIDKEEIIGVALRTKNNVKPLYVSIGHKISLENAIYWVMECCSGYRLPQPTRLAHLAAGGNLKQCTIVI